MSLRSRIFIAVGVVVYIGLAVSILRNHTGLLDALMNAPGYYAIGCACLALAGISMMVAGILLERIPRIGSIGLLPAGIGFAVVNIGVFAGTVSVDRFVIFELAYIIPAVIVAPPVLIIASIIVGVKRRLNRLALFGFAIWVGCVGFAHLWVIAAASASV